MSLIETTYDGTSPNLTKGNSYFMFNTGGKTTNKLTLTDDPTTCKCELTTGADGNKNDLTNIRLLKKHLKFAVEETKLKQRLKATGKGKVHFYQMRAEIEYLHNEIIMRILTDLDNFMWLNKTANQEEESPVTIAQALEIIIEPIKYVWHVYSKLLDMKYGIDITDTAFSKEIEEDKLKLKNELEVVNNKTVEKKTKSKKKKLG